MTLLLFSQILELCSGSSEDGRFLDNTIFLDGMLIDTDDDGSTDTSFFNSTTNDGPCPSIKLFVSECDWLFCTSLFCSSSTDGVRVVTSLISSFFRVLPCYSPP